MELFLTQESQPPASEIIHNLRDYVEKTLIFVTDKDRDLENVNNYGSEFVSIAIITTCICNQWLEGLGWKERKLIKRKSKEADIRLQIDYGKFINASPEEQRLIYIKTIIDSIEVVQEKSKGDFNGKKLIADILAALGVKENDLVGISR